MIFNKLFKKKSPNFLIIGAQKSGTTYLYNLLIQHPEIAIPIRKEIHYFDLNYNLGIDWYLSHFPSNFKQRNQITFEASPYYLYHPLVPKRTFDFNPNIKIIVLLRNPVYRAFSHLKMIENRFNIKINVDSAFIPENEIPIQNYLTKQLNMKRISHSSIHQDFSFISRGVYVNQLKVWAEFFNIKKNIFTIISENLFRYPENELHKLCDFLNINSSIELNYDVGKFKGSYSNDISNQIPKNLYNFYSPYNIELEELLQLETNW